MTRILVVEPQCKGFEHVRFNTGFLATLHYAYPSAAIEFWAEPSHLRNVSEQLRNTPLTPDILIFKPVRLDFPTSPWRRIRWETSFCAAALQHAVATHTSLTAFSSVSSTGLIALKHEMTKHNDIRVVAVPHGVLAGLEHFTKRVWNFPLSIRAAVGLTTPRNLRLIALSRSIYRAVGERYDIRPWFHLPHPYLFDAVSTNGNVAAGPVRVGILGALRWRIEDYHRVVRNVMQRTGNVKFSLVGHVARLPRQCRDFSTYVSGTDNQPVSYGQYEQRAKGLDYILSIADPAQSRYTASTTLLDAFNYCKPGLFLKNPLVDEYSATMGDIGYVANSLDELEDQLSSIAHDIPIDRYRHQQSAIAGSRKVFDPAVLAPTLKAALTE